MKIFSMFFITIIHYIEYSSAMEITMPQYNRLIVVLLSSITPIAVNLFPIITGYLLCNKADSLSRPYKIWCEGWFYSIILLIPGIIISKGNISTVDLAHVFIPLSTHHYWYLTAGIVLYLTIPLYNYLLNNVQASTIKKYLSVIGVAISVFYVSNPFIVSEVYIGHPHGILWMSILYMVGGYIKINKPEKKRWAYIGLASFLAIFVLRWNNIDFQDKNILLFSQYSILPTLMTVSVFILFHDFRISSEKLSAIIAKIAMCSFGVYLIQEHCLIRNWYWNVFNAEYYSASPFLIVQMITSILILWIFAIIGHNIFTYAFNRWAINGYRKVYNRCYKANMNKE